MIKYNFNTHTYKSNYKALYNLESIINTYESENFKSIGISDNINMQYDINSNLYLHPLELKSYLKEIEKIKRKHKNIEISVGFLCDYNIKYSKYLIYLKSFSDYLGLTIKIDANEDYDNYPIICAKKICEAIDTGLFDFITKPDMFLKYRDKVLNKEQYLKECDKALDMICLKAKKFNVPLEINLKYINNIKIMKDNDYPYPTNMFINKLIKYKNTCIVGIDMNNLTDIKKYEISLDKLKRRYPQLNITSIDKNFFKDNKIIEKRKKVFAKNSKTYEYYILKKIMDEISYNADKDEIINKLKDIINDTNYNYSNTKSTLEKNISVTENSILSLELKDKIIKRHKEYIIFNKKTCERKISIIKRVISKIEDLSLKRKKDNLKKSIKTYFSDI